jgi:hypothetical protein
MAPMFRIQLFARKAQVSKILARGRSGDSKFGRFLSEADIELA